LLVGNLGLGPLPSRARTAAPLPRSAAYHSAVRPRSSTALTGAAPPASKSAMASAQKAAAGDEQAGHIGLEVGFDDRQLDAAGFRPEHQGDGVRGTGRLQAPWPMQLAGSISSALSSIMPSTGCPEATSGRARTQAPQPKHCTGVDHGM